MRTLFFGLPKSLRQKVRSIASEKSFEGSQWIKCEIKYTKIQIVLPFVGVGLCLISWALLPSYQGLSWLITISFIGGLSIVYLLGLFTWSLFVAGVYYVICGDLLIDMKNWLVGFHKIVDLHGVALRDGKSNVVTEGEIRFRRQRLRFKFRGPMKNKLTAFARALLQQRDSLAASSSLLIYDPTPLARSWMATISTIAVITAGAFMLLPAIKFYALWRIDQNNYQTAVSNGTASSYRYYLADGRNILYRQNAKVAVISLYDSYISNTDKSTGDPVSIKALHEILVFLRDHNEISVLVEFHSSSKLTETAETELSLRPIVSIFDFSNRSTLESKVIASVGKGFASVFPSDILAIASTDSLQELPTIGIYYTYKNSDSIYYETSQKELPIEKRDLYYGLKIDWTIRATIPGQSPYILASLESEPTPTFSVSSGSSDANIYRKMAETAFDDLAIKLKTSMGLK